MHGRYVDIGYYYQCVYDLVLCTEFWSLDQLKCIRDIHRAGDYLRNRERGRGAKYSDREETMYLCLSLDTKKMVSWRNDDVRIAFNNLIPIFKIKKNIGCEELKWMGWTKYDRYHESIPKDVSGAILTGYYIK